MWIIEEVSCKTGSLESLTCDQAGFFTAVTCIDRFNSLDCRFPEEISINQCQIKSGLFVSETGFIDRLCKGGGGGGVWRIFVVLRWNLPNPHLRLSDILMTEPFQTVFCTSPLQSVGEDKCSVISKAELQCLKEVHNEKARYFYQLLWGSFAEAQLLNLLGLDKNEKELFST